MSELAPAEQGRGASRGRTASVVVAHAPVDAPFARRLATELKTHKVDVLRHEFHAGDGEDAASLLPPAKRYVVVASANEDGSLVQAMRAAESAVTGRDHLFLVRRNDAALPVADNRIWTILGANRERPARVIADEIAQTLESASSTWKRKTAATVLILAATAALAILLTVLSNPWYRAAAALFISGTAVILAATTTLGWEKVNRVLQTAQALITLGTLAFALTGLASSVRSPRGNGATHIVDAPVISFGRVYRGGNLDTQFIRLRLRAHERLTLQWNKLAGHCCMRVYLWRPDTTDATLPTQLPLTEFTVPPGYSTRRLSVPSSGKWILQIGTQNNIPTDPFTLIARSTDG